MPSSRILPDGKGVLMTWPTVSIISLCVYAVLFLIVAVNTPRTLRWLAGQHDAIERYGDKLRAFKYRRLVPWVERLPVSANVLTCLRPILIGGSMFLLKHQTWTGYVFPLFFLGWFTDYLDGLKARAEQDRARRSVGHGQYRESVLGKYLDPIADMISIALMTVACWHFYPPKVIIAFSGAIVARTVLFGLLLWTRRHKATWRQRLSSDILPKTISGEMKAGIIAASFGLVLLWPESSDALLWATRLLIVAIVVEILTLTYLVRTAIRMSRMTVIESSRKTGSD